MDPEHAVGIAVRPGRSASAAFAASIASRTRLWRAYNADSSAGRSADAGMELHRPPERRDGAVDVAPVFEPAAEHELVVRLGHRIGSPGGALRLATAPPAPGWARGSGLLEGGGRR